MKGQRLTYTEVVTDNQTGEVMSEKRVYKGSDEPDFVKLYIDTVCTVKGVRQGLSPILLAFLPHMSYADSNDEWGGQIIFVNKALKEQVARRVGLKIDSVNKAIGEFVRGGIFNRVATATYQVNPAIFGKGDWTQIKNIRAKVDFRARTIEAEIVKGEETEMTQQQDKLQREYDKQMKRSVDNADTLGTHISSSTSEPNSVLQSAWNTP